MLYISIRNIISQRFYVDNNKGKLVIGYYITIDHELMSQIGLVGNFERQVVQLDNVSLPIKGQISLLGQTYLTSYEMRDLVNVYCRKIFYKENLLE